MAKAKKTRTTAVGKRNGRNRDRGKEFEREIANWFKERGYAKAARSFGQSATGNEAPDIAGTPFWLEVGKGRTVRPGAKIKQAFESRALCPNTTYTSAPVVVITHAGGTAPRLVTMDLDTFEGFLRAYDDYLNLHAQKPTMMRPTPLYACGRRGCFVCDPG